jgi:hypothetical protein
MAGVATTNQNQPALAGTFLYSINKFPIIVFGLIKYLKLPRYFLIAKRLTVFPLRMLAAPACRGDLSGVARQSEDGSGW